MDKNFIGKISEAKAIVWLLKQGYYVFDNVMAVGPIDLIAINMETKEVILIDVKTIRPRINKLGEKTYDNVPKINSDIKILGYCPEEDIFIWFYE